MKMNTDKISRFSIKDEMELVISLIAKNLSIMFKRDPETNQETFFRLLSFVLFLEWLMPHSFLCSYTLHTAKTSLP